MTDNDDTLFDIDGNCVWAVDDEKLLVEALDNEDAWLSAEHPVTVRNHR